MEWNTNNKACVSLWFYLDSTKQLKTKFATSEKKKMGILRFYNKLSAEATKAKAEAWAEWYVAYIVTKDGASYEKKFSWASTVKKMVAVMIDPEKTVSDLAAAVDDAILFFKEIQ